MLDCMGVGNGGAPAVTRAYHAGLARSVEVTFKVRPTSASSTLKYDACSRRPMSGGLVLS